MLLIDKKPFQVTKKDLEDKFPNLPKFPLKFELNPAKYRHFDKDNSRWIYPASSPILSRFTYSDNEGQHEVIYYENSIVQKDKTDYLPMYTVDFYNGNPAFVMANQPDKAWYLLHYPKTDVSPYIQKADKESGDWDIVLEDKKKTADEKNAKIKLRNRAYVLLEEMSTTKQRDVLKAIAPLSQNVDEMGAGEVYSYLADEIEKEASGMFKSGVEKFIYYTEGDHTAIKSMIRTALDKGVIIYSHAEKGIYWASEGKMGERIFSVNPTKDYIDQAYVWFKDNPRIMDALQASTREYQTPQEKPKVATAAAELLELSEREELQQKAKALGVKSWHVLSVEKLKEKISELEPA